MSMLPAIDDDLDRFAAIAERDIDLLVLEEVSCSETFAHWFYGEIVRQASAIGLPNLERLTVSARHSVNYSGNGAGESDLELVFRGTRSGEPCTVICLCESKIDARFTAEQPERYRIRAREIASRQSAQYAVTALVAPSAYLQQVDRTAFDSFVSHEAIMQIVSQPISWSESEQNLRRMHRLALLRHAIERHRRGGNRINDEERTSFFDHYNQIIVGVAPSLRQKPPRDRSKKCDTFFFEVHPRLSKASVAELYIEHHMDEGWVAIHFRGWGLRRDHYAAKLQEIVLPEHEIDAPPGKHLMRVRISSLPVIDLDLPVSEQTSRVEECARATERLLKWYQQHHSTMEQWSAVAST